jgi:hypothetical protein
MAPILHSEAVGSSHLPLLGASSPPQPEAHVEQAFGDPRWDNHMFVPTSRALGRATGI